MTDLSRPKHLVLYDGECAFCNQMIRNIIYLDKKKRLVFSSLQGKTAQQFYPLFLQKENFLPDSIVLIENFKEDPKVTFYGKAVLRIFWIIGGFWTCLGIVSFFPKIIYDPLYRWVARHRHQLISNKIKTPPQEETDRFLP